MLTEKFGIPRGNSNAGSDMSHAVLLRAFLQSHEAVLVSDSENRIVSINPTFTKMTGWTLAETKGKQPKVLASGHTLPSTYAALWQALETTDFWQGELWNRRKDGTIFLKWTSISVIRDAAGAAINYVATFTEIAEHDGVTNGTAERLAHLAYHDPLTQLPNRQAFESQLDLTLKTACRGESMLALMLIDLDRFKNINDTLGHHVGDSLLKEVAKRLRESVRSSDIIARLGGDEFIVVLLDIEGPLTAAGVAGKVQRNLADSYRVGEHILYATPSIGISVFPNDGHDRNILLRNADTAMYHAKAAGRNNYQFYTASMNAAASEHLLLENALRQAVSTITPEVCQFSLHFQPQVDVGSSRVIGLEALARWHHPEFGNIPPDRFIALAEETGLIQPLGDWIFWESCRQLRAFRDAGIADIRLAINISAQQLRHETLSFVILGALACYDLTPADIEIEITETTSMQNPELTRAILLELSHRGIAIAIDDFGTGYSSLAYLKHLPIQRLKLDRSFVSDIEIDPNDAAICSATIALGHNLGLEIVAEGVETFVQRDFLAKLGCDIVQGYLYSRPLPATEIIAYLQAQRAVNA